MGRVHDGIDGPLAEWIAEQQMFFVATAALDADSTVNISPKGMADTFAILDEETVAYLDLTGSGIETVAHLRENGRITLMWCAFSGPPRIVRIHGRGDVVLPHDRRWKRLAASFGEHRGARAIVVVTMQRVSDSCGYSVPLMDFVAERDVLTRWAERKTDEELDEYRQRKNASSIDGLVGIGPDDSGVSGTNESG